MFTNARAVIVATAVACGFAATGVGLRAQFPPLPAFAVAAPGGGAVSSTSLSTETKFVLVYVRPGVVATTRLLDALAAWRLAPEHLRRLVLIVEGPADKAAQYLAGAWKPENGALTWFADPNGQAAQALGLTGAPALRGVKAGAVEWSLEGVLNDPAAYEPTVKTWIGAVGQASPPPPGLWRTRRSPAAKAGSLSKEYSS